MIFNLGQHMPSCGNIPKHILLAVKFELSLPISPHKKLKKLPNMIAKKIKKVIKVGSD